VPNNNWMAAFPDNTRLEQLVMPGSHDACIYELRDTCAEVDWVRQSSITQFLTIGEQLEAGTRFFDIRLYKDRDSGVLRPGHFPDKGSSSKGMGEYGPPFDDIVTQIKTFLAANTT
jgi:hypothetical protein